MHAGRLPPVPPLRGPLDPDGYVEVVGERCALFGRERGPFEWWAWPLKVVSELRLTLHLRGAAAPIALEALPGECEVTPGGLEFVHRGADFTLRQSIVCDPEHPVLTWLLEVDGEREFDAELACVCDLRPMWPAGLGGQLGLRDPVTGALAVTEETGRYAAFLGAVGGRVREAPDGRGLPRRPVRLIARLRPGEATPFVFAAAQRHQSPPSPISRVGRGQAASGTWAARRVIDDARNLWRTASEDWRAVQARSRAKWARFDQRAIALRCGAADVERAFTWGQVVAERSWVRAPGLGRVQVAGLAPSGGGDRPGYGWCFDADALDAAAVAVQLGDFAGAAASLWGASGRQRADGKLAHEVTLSAPLCDWYERYPYAYYRGATAASFVATLERYGLASGDVALCRALLPRASAALDWLWSTRGDDGLASTSRAGLGAVQAGPLSEVVEADAHLHGGLFRALVAGERLAAWLGDDDLAQRCRERASDAAEAFESLWDPNSGRYAFAISREGRTLADRSAFVATALAAGLGEDERAARAAGDLLHPELATAWGLRPLGSEAPHYHPDNYNGGAVMPAPTAAAALACYRVGRVAEGHQLLATLAGLLGLGGRGLVEEHLAGDRARLTSRRVPRLLGASTAIHTALLDGALGLRLYAARGDAPDRVALRVQHPLPWPELSLCGLRVGARRFDLAVSRRRTRTDDGAQTELCVEVTPTDGGAPLALELGAVLPACSEVVRVGDGARDLEVQVRELASGAEELSVAAAPAGAVTATFVQGPHLAVSVRPPARNAASEAIHSVLTRADARGATYTVTGPAGRTVELTLSCDHQVSVAGADRARVADGSEVVVVTLPSADGERATTGVEVALTIDD